MTALIVVVIALAVTGGLIRYFDPHDETYN